MKQKENKDYYLGVDIGTDSVGYAVTDESYHILKFNGKSMWGSRLFDSAKTAEERRVFRTGRRRYQRRAWRIQLLQELFAEEICKVDAGFFQRMKESNLLEEDKESMQPYSLFHDNNYTDTDYYKEFPTIYHLRKELIIGEKEYDVRLIYLALHHILKHRGHFLFAGSMESATSFHETYETFQRCLQDEFDIELECSSVDVLAEVLKSKYVSKTDKKNKVMELLHCEKKDKQLKAIIDLICGLKSKLGEVFGEEKLSKAEQPSVSFSESSYDDIRSGLEEILEERCGILDIIKSVYDWAVLADILTGGEYENQSYLSFAKVKLYDKHKEDLELLKRITKEYSREEYKEFFQKKETNNYCAYIGFYKKNGEKCFVKKCTREDFLKKLKKLVQTVKDNSGSSLEIEYIEKEIENDTFLPLQVSKENGILPYQVHGMELKQILANAEKYLEFLRKTDEKGKSVSEKVLQLFEFRIPYYVGPLNTTKGNNSWMVRKQNGVITPWNFHEIVDEDQSAEQFIRRMTNKCTYLVGKDVLPKNSLLYCEFMVWNELNNVRIGNEKLSVEQKQEIYQQIFKQKKRVTGKMLMNYLRSEGMNIDMEEISGFDQNFKASLGTYLDFKKIFGEKIEEYTVQKMVEDIILCITLYGDETKMLKRVIRKRYDEQEISEEQLGKISRLKYSGWGRLSREFLTEIEGADRETGEIRSIIQALRDTNDNLMQILGQKYTYLEEIEYKNAKEIEQVSISYDTLIKDMVASPAIKRSAWQVVLIAEEIKKIMGKAPKKIFIEMARGNEKVKKRAASRKSKIIELYSKCKEEEYDWKQELKNRPEGDFKSIKFYLYCTQMGKCMYSGETIDLSQLADATVYDRDHIYPQSKTKDDSLDNLVLVRKTANAKKSDGIVSPEIQKKMSEFWKILKKKGFISEEKYCRLMRTTPLTDEELAGYINRQLVETRQSSKVVANLFKQIYSDSMIVYVKAGAVADFRRGTLKQVKVREMNDYHHAKDAYLNIIVGNVYYEKFTGNPLQWLKKTKDRNYSLNRMFDFNLSKNGREIWKTGKNGTLSVIRKYMNKNDILYTRYATTNKAEFFEEQLSGKDKNPTVPMKKGMDVKKYGGYKTVRPAYFALVESEDKKGKKQRSIESVPLYLEKRFQQEGGSFLQYCIEQYGLKNPRIILPKIKKDAYMIIDNFPMHLRGTTGKQLSLQGAVQLCLDEENTVYLKRVEKYIQNNLVRTNKNELLTLCEKDGITAEMNIKLFDELCRKQKETIYQYRPANQYKKLCLGKEKFEGLCCEEQCIVLNEILHLLQCRQITANLTLIGASKDAGKMGVNKVITNCEEARLIHQSVTGLFEQEIDLLNL